jgi:hypothetical protein
MNTYIVSTIVLIEPGAGPCMPNQSPLYIVVCHHIPQYVCFDSGRFLGAFVIQRRVVLRIDRKTLRFGLTLTSVHWEVRNWRHPISFRVSFADSFVLAR